MERCTATRHSTGDRCKRWPTSGATVCRTHGSGAPQVKRAAARRIAEAKTVKILAKHGTILGDDLDPLTALQVVISQTIALKEDLIERVAALKADEMRYRDDHGGEQLRSEWILLERALDRCGKLLIDCARLNLDERLVRISEAQAAVVVAVIRGALLDLGHDPAEDDVQLAVGRHLRALEGSA
jgi:hypothetical protein